MMNGHMVHEGTSAPLDGLDRHLEPDGVPLGEKGHKSQVMPMPDLLNLVSKEDVKKVLAQLSLRSGALDGILHRQVTESKRVIDEAGNNIQKVAPQLNLIHDEIEVLSSRLDGTARTAEKVSKRIRSLDEEKKRLKLATQWAMDTSELKVSLSSLSQAIDDADWDAAVKHCIKAMSIPAEVLHSRFAASVVPSTELPEDPATTLLGLRKRLLDLFVRAFRRAIQEKEQADATRFFKLLPRIGWRDEGLQAYSDFAKELVRDHGRGVTEALANSNSIPHPYYFSTILTRLFEHMALLVDRHQPLVDKHYGNGSFAAGVMNGLQEECDRLGSKILRSWKEERKVRRKVESSRAYRFTFHESLSAPSKFGSNTPVRPSTPSAGGGAAAPGLGEDDGSERREVDQMLSEAAAIGAAWGTYRRFLKGRLSGETQAPPLGKQAGDEDEKNQEEKEEDAVKDFRENPLSPSVSRANGLPTLNASYAVDTPSIADTCQLGREVREVLHEEYVLLETWHLRSSLERAHRIDTSDPTVRPLTSSILDDAFFVIRAVLARVLSTSDVDAADAMIGVIKKAIESDFTQVIARRLENAYKSASSNMTVEGPRKETASREMRTKFVTYLNVLSVANTYADRITRELGSEAHLEQYYDGVEELKDLGLAMHTLEGVGQQIRGTLRMELDQLFAQLTRPKLRPILTEAYRDATYLLDEASFAEAEASEQVQRRFIKGWDQVLAIYKDIFNEANFATYHSLAIDQIVRPWEKLIMGMRFTELGALRFDKDLRSISTYIAGQTSLGVREKFVRLQQISYVLNLDQDEDDENAFDAAAASGMSWRLSAAEVGVIRSLRQS